MSNTQLYHTQNTIQSHSAGYGFCFRFPRPSLCASCTFVNENYQYATHDLTLRQGTQALLCLQAPGLLLFLQALQTPLNPLYLVTWQEGARCKNDW